MPHWLDTGNTAWQLTAATFVGLMSVPGLVVLYGGVMQKRWSINSMMLTLTTFSVVIVIWVLYAFKMGFGHPLFNGGAHPASDGFIKGLVGTPSPTLSSHDLTMDGTLWGGYGGSPVGMPFPEAAFMYFQLVFAAITPILALGSVLGRVNFKAWIPFVVLWISLVYVVDAFLIWGGGFFALHGVLDYSGGYVIHLSAGVSGFVAAAVIGPRLQRDREVDAPNNVAMVAVGAGLLWMGWNGFNGGDPYAANQSAAAAVLNTNLTTAVAFLVWVAMDYMTGRKPSLLGGVNGIITGLVAITPAAGFVNGWGAIIIGIVASAMVYLAMNYLSRMRPFRNVDDTLGVVYTHGFAGLAGGILTGLLSDPKMSPFFGIDATKGLFYGSATLLKWQVLAGLWVVVWSGVMTFILLKVVGLFVPLRMSTENMEIGDIAEHGHEVYPSDIPSLGAFQEASAPATSTA